MIFLAVLTIHCRVLLSETVVSVPLGETAGQDALYCPSVVAGVDGRGGSWFQKQPQMW